MGAVYLIDEQINFNFESFQEKHYWAMQIYGSKVFSLHSLKLTFILLQIQDVSIIN